MQKGRETNGTRAEWFHVEWFEPKSCVEKTKVTVWREVHVHSLRILVHRHKSELSQHVSTDDSRKKNLLLKVALSETFSTNILDIWLIETISKFVKYRG